MSGLYRAVELRGGPNQAGPSALAVRPGPQGHQLPGGFDDEGTGEDRVSREVLGEDPMRRADIDPQLLDLCQAGPASERSLPGPAVGRYGSEATTF